VVTAGQQLNRSRGDKQGFAGADQLLQKAERCDVLRREVAGSTRQEIPGYIKPHAPDTFHPRSFPVSNVPPGAA
jgi:hypothetical protein